MEAPRGLSSFEQSLLKLYMRPLARSRYGTRFDLTLALCVQSVQGQQLSEVPDCLALLLAELMLDNAHSFPQFYRRFDQSRNLR